MEVKFSTRSAEQLKTPPASMSGVVFGTVFSDHMFCMEWEEGKGWHNAEIKPYGPLMLEPSSMVLHYAQMSFEGLKAYWTDSGEHVLFRPRENFKRMNRTSLRMCLPELDVEEVLTALKQLLRLDSEWVPKRSRNFTIYSPNNLGYRRGNRPESIFQILVLYYSESGRTVLLPGI